MTGLWPSIDEVKTLLRLNGVTVSPDEEDLLQSAVDTANDYGNRRTNFVYDQTADVPVPVPSPANYAAKIHAARLYRRRDSTDGTLGVDMTGGAIRIGRTDPDIEALYALLGPMVVG